MENFLFNYLQRRLLYLSNTNFEICSLLTRYGRGLKGVALTKIAFTGIMITNFILNLIYSVEEIEQIDITSSDLSSRIKFFISFVNILSIMNFIIIILVVYAYISFLRSLFLASQSRKLHLLKRIFYFEIIGLLTLIIIIIVPIPEKIIVRVVLNVISLVSTVYLGKWVAKLIEFDFIEKIPIQMVRSIQIMKIGLFLKLLELLRLFYLVSTIGTILSYIGETIFIIGMWKIANGVSNLFNINQFMEKQGYYYQEIEKEQALLFMIMGPGGIPLFINSFSRNWDDQEEIIGGFLSAFNSMGFEFFSQSIENMKFGENNVLVQFIEPFMVCYVIRGETYLAHQKLSKFTEVLKSTQSIWDKLISSSKKGMILSAEQIPALQNLIVSIFG